MSLDLFGERDADFGVGANYFLPNLAAAQVELGHEPIVHLLTCGRPSRRRVRGFDVQFHRCVQPPARLGLQKRFGRQISPSMVRSLRHGSVDLVHFHGLRNSQLMLAWVARRCRSRGVPIVAHDQGRRLVTGIEAWCGRHALPRLSACIISTAETHEALVASGYDPGRIHFVPNGFDPGVFYPGGEASDEAGRLRILIVSRLTPEKDPLTAARGVEALARRLPVDLTVIGGGPLAAAIASVLERSTVRLRLLGHLPQAELGNYYRHADVFVLTSLHEAWNQSVVEAMACGLPVVATDVPGLRDAVCGAGTLVPASDPAALCDALARLAQEPGTRRALRQAGLARAAELTWDRVARRIGDIYREVLATRPPATRPSRA